MRSWVKVLFTVLFISLFSFGCGGGGGGGSTDDGGGPGPDSTYAISGTITVSGGVALQGVTMTLSGAGSGNVTTNASGNYSLSGLKNGAYTITPSLTGYTFSPASKSVTINGVDVSANNFIATGSGIVKPSNLIAFYENSGSSWVNVIAPIVSGATNYKLYSSTDGVNYTYISENPDTLGNCFGFFVDAKNLDTYFKITALTIDGESEKSEPVFASHRTIPTFTITYPTTNQLGVSVTPTIRWNSSPASTTDAYILTFAAYDPALDYVSVILKKCSGAVTSWTVDSSDNILVTYLDKLTGAKLDYATNYKFGIWAVDASGTRVAEGKSIDNKYIKFTTISAPFNIAGTWAGTGKMTKFICGDCPDIGEPNQQAFELKQTGNQVFLFNPEVIVIEGSISGFIIDDHLILEGTATVNIDGKIETVYMKYDLTISSDGKTMSGTLIQEGAKCEDTGICTGNFDVTFTKK